MTVIDGVSVIIPTHNRADMVVAAVQSALSQRVAELEVIVVDDGSTDATVSALAPLREQGVRYIYQPQAGGPAARNRGADAASHPYLVFLDSDDVLLPSGLVALLETASRLPVIGVVGGGFQQVDASLNLIQTVEPWRRTEALDLTRWVVDCAFVIGATLVSRDWYRRVGGFDVTLAAAQDWDLWLRLSLAGCPMAWCREIVCQYRQHAGGLTRSTARRKQAALAALDKVFERPTLPAEVAQRRDQAYGLVHLHAAAQYYATGQAEAARPELEQAALRLREWRDPVALLAAVLRIGRNLNIIVDANAFQNLVFASHRHRRGLRRRVLARLEADEIFAAYFRQDWARVRRGWWRVVAYDPAWLGNRGFLAIGARAVRGRPVNGPAAAQTQNGQRA